MAGFLLWLVVVAVVAGTLPAAEAEAVGAAESQAVVVAVATMIGIWGLFLPPRLVSPVLVIAGPFSVAYHVHPLTFLWCRWVEDRMKVVETLEMCDGVWILVTLARCNLLEKTSTCVVQSSRKRAFVTHKHCGDAFQPRAFLLYYLQSLILRPQF
jgi:hypothetical protein